eukprot:1673296-Karenia_brevis.AAC.1
MTALSCQIQPKHGTNVHSVGQGSRGVDVVDSASIYTHDRANNPGTGASTQADFRTSQCPC